MAKKFKLQDIREALSPSRRESQEASAPPQVLADKVAAQEPAAQEAAQKQAPRPAVTRPTLAEVVADLADVGAYDLDFLPKAYSSGSQTSPAVIL